MTGPYSAQIFLNADVARLASDAEPDLTLTWPERIYFDGQTAELPEGDRIAGRFYRSGGGATLVGTTRAAVFYIGSILAPGESAYVRIVGREPSTGRTFAADETVRRDDAGRLVSGLGSRFGERVFQGI